MVLLQRVRSEGDAEHLQVLYIANINEYRLSYILFFPPLVRNYIWVSIIHHICNSHEWACGKCISVAMTYSYIPRKLSSSEADLRSIFWGSSLVELDRETTANSIYKIQIINLNDLNLEMSIYLQSYNFSY